MAVTIFPETGDTISESAWQGLNNALSGNASWTTEGYDVTVSSGITLDVAAGEALVNGYLVSSDATQQVVLTDNATNYLWLEPDGTLTDNTTGTNPGNALLLATIVTAAAAVSSITKDQDVTTGPFIYIRKTADENVASSTVLQDDDHLSVALQPGIYRFTIVLEATWSAAVGLKLALQNSATNANINCAVIYSSSSGSTPAGWYYLTTYGGTASYQTNAGTNDPVMIDGSISMADAGTFKMQWAQVTSNATNTTLHSGSRMFIERIT